jgi:hypothetical protein
VCRAPALIQSKRYMASLRPLLCEFQCGDSRPQKGYFKGRERHFSCLDFIAQLTLHIPPRGRHLLRRYRLYSSRGRGTWKDRPALASCAPQNWYGRQAAQPPAPGEPTEVHAASASDSRKAWARLLAMIYDVDPWRCPKCSTDYVWR